MAVVVTGAAGFIGRVLVDQLLSDDLRVVAIDRRGLPSRPRLTTLAADLLGNGSEVHTALREAEAVIHLAGAPGVRDRCADVEHRRHRDNVQATARVCDLVPSSVPLIVASSSSVYGGVRRGRACREGDPPQPKGGYAVSKLHAEAECRRRLAAGGHVLVVRPFTVVGEGQRPDMALSRWAEALVAGRPLRVFGSLDRTRDFTDVREVARGLRSLLTSSATGTVNLGSGRPRRLAEMVSVLSQVLDVPARVEVTPAARHEVADTWADPRRFAALTGFVPHTDLVDVVRRMVETPGFAPRSTPALSDALAAAG